MAQGGSAAAPASAAASAPRVAASSAMERAQRAADSPLRAILEAARTGKRSGSGEATDNDALRRIQANANAGPAARAPAEAPRNQPAAPDAASGAVPLSELVTIRTLPDSVSAPTRSPPLGPVPAPVAARAPASAAVELPRVDSSALPQLLAAKLELVRMVEPQLPPRLLDQLTRPEVTVEFTIEPDGSVINVNVLPPVPRQAVPLIVSSVEQWRFAPLLVSRTHRVQLVFNR